MATRVFLSIDDRQHTLNKSVGVSFVSLYSQITPPTHTHTRTHIHTHTHTTHTTHLPHPPPYTQVQKTRLLVNSVVIHFIRAGGEASKAVAVGNYTEGGGVGGEVKEDDGFERLPQLGDDLPEPLASVVRLIPSLSNMLRMNGVC